MNTPYKIRYLQTIFNTLTYEKNNLIRLLHYKVYKQNQKRYRLTYHQRKKILRAAKQINEARRLIQTFKGIEE